jgi:hypothetical protein
MAPSSSSLDVLAQIWSFRERKLTASGDANLTGVIKKGINVRLSTWIPVMKRYAHLAEHPLKLCRIRT